MLFNNKIHRMSLKKNEATIFGGTIIILEAVHKSYPQIAQGHFYCLLRRSENWLTRIKQNMFNETPIDYNITLNSSTIKNSWKEGEVVKLDRKSVV